MKKLFVLFALMAITSLHFVGAIPQGAEIFQLGYFSGNTLGGGPTSKNISITASSEGTFTTSGGFGNFCPSGHAFWSQTKGNWTVTFNEVELYYGGTLRYSSIANVESYSNQFLPNWTYRVTYTVTRSSGND